VVSTEGASKEGLGGLHIRRFSGLQAFEGLLEES
jgi:hypothetical protein